MSEKKLLEVAGHVREQFEKGKAAFNRQNLDYAIEIFNGVLKLEPGFVEARAALRATQIKRAGAGRGFLGKMFGKASASPALAKAQMLARRNPLEAIYTVEQVLNTDPSNAMAHRILAEAATGAGMPKTALMSLEHVFKQNTSDKKMALLTADAYANAGQIAKAESIYAEVLRANPNDPELAQALKDLSARRTMAEGGYDNLNREGGSYRDILKDKALAVHLERAQRSVSEADTTLKLIAEYQAQLEQEPDNLKLVRQIADRYLDLKDYASSLDYFNKLKDATGGSDPALDKKITEIALTQIDIEMAALDKEDVDYETSRDALAKRRVEVEIQSARLLVERYPSDLQFRFELGKILFQAGRISEAIQELQKAQANPHRRVATLNLLGQCFHRRGLNDVAVRTFQRALEEKTSFDDEKKELIYQLGVALEAMGKKEEAIEQFKQIYEVDIGFRDVGERVDAYYSDQVQ